MIEILIKIPDPYYKELITTDDFYLDILGKTVKNGIPLPKNHGDLIDAGKIQFENADFDTYGDYCRAFDAIDQADTIIEADKGSEE